MRKLPNGYMVKFVAPLKRHCIGRDGAARSAPTRFLVLGRKPSQHGIRPIVCAGNVFPDRLEVDSGVIDAELSVHVLAAFGAEASP